MAAVHDSGNRGILRVDDRGNGFDSDGFAGGAKLELKVGGADLSDLQLKHARNRLEILVLHLDAVVTARKRGDRVIAEVVRWGRGYAGRLCAGDRHRGSVDCATLSDRDSPPST